VCGLFLFIHLKENRYRLVFVYISAVVMAGMGDGMEMEWR
jgi:hypothetical protein